MAESKWEKIKRLIGAFFCNPWRALTCKSNGTFSSKKSTAMFFLSLSAIHWVWLLFCPNGFLFIPKHWTILLSNAQVPESVIITLIAKLAVLTLGSLTVYGWAKSNGAE